MDDRKPRHGKGEPLLNIEGRLRTEVRKAEGRVVQLQAHLKEARHLARQSEGTDKERQTRKAVVDLTAELEEAMTKAEQANATLAAFFEVWTRRGFKDGMGWPDIERFQDPRYGYRPPPEPLELPPRDPRDALEDDEPVVRAPPPRPMPPAGAAAPIKREASPQPSPPASRKAQGTRPAEGSAAEPDSRMPEKPRSQSQLQQQPQPQPKPQRDAAAEDAEPYKVGPGKPPLHTRFKKGEPSANPEGRGKGGKNTKTVLKELLAEPVQIKQNGRPKKITKHRAFMLRTINDAVMGGAKARADLLKLMRDYLGDETDAPKREGLSAEDRKILENHIALRKLLGDDDDEPGEG